MLKRVGTAVVAVPALVGLCLYVEPSWFLGLLGLVLLGGWREAAGLAATRVHVYRRLGLAVGVLVMWWGAVGLSELAVIALAGGLLTVGVAGVMEGRQAEPGRPLDQLLSVALTSYLLVYVFGTGLHLLWLYQLSDGPRWMVALMAMVWGADSAAYFFGTWFGRHKMLGPVSPLKSWEGLAAALIVPALAALAVPEEWLPVSGGTLVGLTVAVALAAQLGDALESLLKRFSSHKDSGGWVPGHGGLLDKLDSFLVAGPVLYYLVIMGGW